MINDTDAEKDRLLSLINFEISSRVSAVSRPGWSPWAILAAISYLVWLFLEDIEKSEFVWSNSYFVYFIVSLTFDFFVVFFACISNLFESSKTGNRRLSYFYEKAGLFFVVLILREVSLLIAVIRLFPDLSLPSYYAFACWLNIIIGLSFLLLGLFFTNLFLKVPIPTSPNQNLFGRVFGNTIVIAWLFSGSYAVYASIITLAAGNIHLAINEWRVGLIGFACSI